MRTIVIIGANKSGSSQDAIAAAEKLGFYTFLLTNRKSFLRKKDVYPYIHEMMLTDLDDMDSLRTVILNLVKERGIQLATIMSSIDPYVSSAAILCHELGLPGQSAPAIATMLDKAAVRNLLSDTKYTVGFTTESDLSPQFLRNLPIVVKCPRSNGSKDVFLAKTRDEVEQHIRGLKLKYPDNAVLCEEFIGGQQYLVEVLVHQGQPHVIALIEQTVTLTVDGRFIVTGYKIRPSYSKGLGEMVDDLVRTVTTKSALASGAFHIEFKVVNGNCKVIEINPRISGTSMNQMISYAFGINLAEETLKSQLGITPNVTRSFEKHVYTKFITVTEAGRLTKITGRNRARQVPGVAQVYVKPKIGTKLVPPTSMGHRYAYVIALGKDEREAESAAVKAAGLIKFHTTKVRLSNSGTHT